VAAARVGWRNVPVFLTIYGLSNLAALLVLLPLAD
jgi:hypothetical protein